VSTDTVLAENSQAVNERPNQSEKPTLLCQIVFMALGLLLLAAACSKTYQVYSQPMQTLETVGTVGLIGLEFFFGTWLFIGIRSAWTLWTAVVCFAAFASFSAYKYLTGASSCGCFGTLPVNPLITLVMDMVAVSLLLSCRAGVETVSAPRMYKVLTHLAPLALALLFVPVSASLYGQSRFMQGGSRTSAGDLVVLDPESWLGTRWQLLSDSGLAAELGSGTWEVLLFRHDCHVCHDVMLEIERILSTGDAAHRVALICIDKPTHDDVQVTRLQQLGCLLGQLPQDRAWFATTPLRVRLNDSMCVSATVIKHWE
jgi:hypothetical protein